MKRFATLTVLAATAVASTFVFAGSAEARSTSTRGALSAIQVHQAFAQQDQAQPPYALTGESVKAYQSNGHPSSIIRGGRNAR